jgi:CRISPR-associated protein Cmr3
MTSALQESFTQSAYHNARATDARWLQLSPVDAWFFRDGRPYNASESNQTDVVSLFPPPATTLVGAIRAALARSKGWDGRSNWDNNKTLAEVLGKSFDDLGALSFRGPWLVRSEDNCKTEFLFPMPLHVLGELRAKTPEEQARENIESSEDDALLWEPHCLLTPPGHTSLCDLGDVRLPVPHQKTANGLKEPSSLWVTQTGLELILKGQLPGLSHIVAADRLWKHEVRVGLQRCEETRTTKEGALYSPRFVRLKRGVSVVMSVTGLPGDWQVPELLPLGGEGRLADCQSHQPLDFPDVLKAPTDGQRSGDQSFRIAVVLLTPLLPDDGEKSRGLVVVPSPGQKFFQTEGTTVISACVGKPLSLGGWNSLERRPLDLRPVVPAGSVWFLEVDNLPAFAESAANGFGLKTKYGFGQVAIGVWPQSRDSGETT